MIPHPSTESSALNYHVFRLLPLLVLLGIFLAITVPFPAQAAMSKSKQQRMLDMLDQLDRMDNLDLNEAISEAELCTIERNFNCAKNKLNLAKNYANSDEDKQVIENGWRKLRAEIRQKEREDEEREEMEAEMERMREEQEEAEREYASRIEDTEPAFDLNKSISDSIRNAGQDIQQFQQKLDRDTNAAIRKTNELLEIQRRQREAEQRRKQMADARQARQQAYEQKQREQRRRSEELERIQRQRREEEERRQREMDAKRERMRREQENRLANSRSDNKGQLNLQVSTSDTQVEVNQPAEEKHICYESAGHWWRNDESGQVYLDNPEFWKRKSVGDTIYTTRGTKGVIYSFEEFVQTFHHHNTSTGKDTTAHHTHFYVVAKVEQTASCRGQGEYSNPGEVGDEVRQKFPDRNNSGGSTISQ